MIDNKSNYNPDVLSCIANLSSDEVFTPPELANKMIDLLPQELFKNPDATFLDPACKSGVFLREIAKRLMEGLKDVIPDETARLENIFKRQLFGIAITELTGHLSRRSLYCSKNPAGKYSVVQFDNDKDGIQGNIRFKIIKHTWNGDKCEYCGASKAEYGGKNREGMETHAYELIHTINPEDIFKMKFDVIIGNPPYQLSDGGGNGASAKPIYHYFVNQAKKLNPYYMSFIIPSRWFTGGKGLDDFRNEMLHDERIRVIHDYPEANDCFNGVQIKGGVSFFLWDKDHPGLCSVYSHRGNDITGPVTRPLLENDCETFIRYNEAIPILHKIKSYSCESFESLVSVRMPFGLPNTFKGNDKKNSKNDLIIYVSGNERDVRGQTRYVSQKDVPRGYEMLDWNKVFIAKAGSGSDKFPHPILPKPFYGAPKTLCNESYLVIGPFKNKDICKNVMSYIATKFFRFMVLLKKNSQNAPKSVYQFVPIQDFTEPWTDEKLYKKYKLTEDEVAFIESMIKPMELEADDNG